MSLKIVNSAYGILAAGISSSATTIPLSTGHGTRFGSFATGDYMFATLIDPSNQLEIVKITGRSGDNLTVVREQDGTTGLAFSSGDRLECRPCNAAFKAAMFEAGYGADVGVADAYALSLSVLPPAYFDGMRVYFKATNPNTGACTLDVGGLGVKALKYFDGSDLNSGQILAGQIIEAVYQGAFFQVINTILSGSPWSTGDGKLTLKTSADAGWVMMNDGTLGNAASGASTRANADTAALFALLWNNTLQADCAVSSGRGASAAADFAANKTIALPKELGRALAIAGTGAGLTARALGSAVGAETHTLTGAQSGVAAHGHGGSVAAGGGGPQTVSIPVRTEGGSTEAPQGISSTQNTPNASVNVSITLPDHPHGLTINNAPAANAAEAHPIVGPRAHWNVMVKL